MLDTIGSSDISAQQVLMQQLRKQRNPDEMSSNLISKHDTDGDELLSFEEIGMKEEHFNEADADGDGLLSKDELSADMQAKMQERMQALADGHPRPPMGMGGGKGPGGGGKPNAEEMASEIFDELDTNEDGYVSLEESLADEESFNKIDSDADGMISEEELASDISSHMEQMRQMMGPPPHQAGDIASEDDSFKTLMDALSEDDEDSEEDEVYESLDVLA